MTGPWAAAVAVHAVTLCALAVIALRLPLHGRVAVALAAALYNAIPVSPLLGVPTPIFLHDACVPLALAVVLARGAPGDRPLLTLCAFAALLWPAVGTGVGLLASSDLGESAQFLYRRLGFVAFFAAGLSGVLRRGQVRSVTDAGLFVWVAMALAGLLQYAGLVDTDLASKLDPDLRGESIAESFAAARGFMGLNRGAVGVWGSAAAVYAFVMLACVHRAPALQAAGYGLAALVSIAVLLLSGSRTGLLATVAGVAYTAARLALGGRPGRALRVVAGTAGVAAAVALAASDLNLEVLSSRFSLAAGVAETGQQRAAVQRATIGYVLEDVRALGVGMGHSVAEFRRHVGSRFQLAHSHSEYVDVLWEAGAVGLALYALFVAALYGRLRPPRGAPPGAIFAGRSLLVTGAVAGLAVGNIFVTAARLAPFSYLMAFVYGALVSEARRAVPAPGAAAAPPPSGPVDPRWSVPC